MFYFISKNHETALFIRNCRHEEKFPKKIKSPNWNITDVLPKKKEKLKKKIWQLVLGISLYKKLFVKGWL